MKLSIDTDARTLTVDEGADARTLPLYSAEAFELIADVWVKVGWNEKYSYSFSWMGRPIIQLPEDMIRMQEVIWQVKPDVIIETGVAHGGSLIYYASLCKAMGKGRVIGVDIEIRPHNRKAIESHELAGLITLIEGSSIDPTVIERVRGCVREGETVLVLLDSCHEKLHVLRELELYAPLVSVGSYIIATDGIMQELVQDGAHVPRAKPDWSWNNPQQAVREFLRSHPEFELHEPPFAFNEGEVKKRITYWPNGMLKRMR